MKWRKGKREVKTCPHGVRVTNLCAICTPDKFYAVTGLDDSREFQGQSKRASARPDKIAANSNDPRKQKQSGRRGHTVQCSICGSFVRSDRLEKHQRKIHGP